MINFFIKSGFSPKEGLTVNQVASACKLIIKARSVGKDNSTNASTSGQPKDDLESMMAMYKPYEDTYDHVNFENKGGSLTKKEFK